MSTTAWEIAARVPDCHPFMVAARVAILMPRNHDAFLAALLHDSIEDGYATIKELSDSNLPTVVVATVFELTRQRQEPYSEYIERIATSRLPMAIQIKIADAQEDLRRCQEDGDAARGLRYEIALARLYSTPEGEKLRRLK